jgi:hypothetical protein
MKNRTIVAEITDPAKWLAMMIIKPLPKGERPKTAQAMMQLVESLCHQAIERALTPQIARIETFCGMSRQMASTARNKRFQAMHRAKAEAFGECLDVLRQELTPRPRLGRRMRRLRRKERAV